MHSAVAVSAGGVRIIYIRSAPAGRSSIAAAPVAESHLFYTPVCCFAVNCTAELFCGCCSAVLCVSRWLDVNYFSGEL